MWERISSNLPFVAATSSLALALGAHSCKRSANPPGVAAPPGAPVASGPAPVPPPPPILPPAARIEDEKNTIQIFRSTAAAAVFVTQKQVVVDYWAGRAMEVPAGAGSGFVWDKQGHVVTNFHVAEGGRPLVVKLQDQRSFPASLIGGDARKDIAVLKINAPANALTPVQLPIKGHDVEVGQTVIAIGNPFGLDHTLTTGIVSALGREVPGAGGVAIRDMIQTDAAINPGNSGGPLLDSAGRLIGMNTAIFSRSGAWAGVGFAVPVSTINRIVPQIIATGKVEQVGLGIRIDTERRLEKRARISGVAVISVEPNTPAAKSGLQGMIQSPAGIQLGDVIIGIDNDEIKTYDDLYNTLDRRKVGDKVNVKVQRGGKPLTLSIELIRVQ